jgi:membrane-associated protein
LDVIGELIGILTDPKSLILGFGALAYVGLFAIVFAESGLFFGFFLPGDSLLFTAGVIASQEIEGQQILQLPIVIVVVVVAAILGDAVGYTFGRRVGRRLYERPDSRFFKRSHLLAAEAFYEKHGGMTIVVARFMPFVRTFAPIVAGTAQMRYPRFALFNISGALLWGISLPLIGYIAGEAAGEQIDRFLLVIVGGIVLLSVLPTAIQVIRSNRTEIAARLPRRGPRPVASPEPTED